MGSVITEYLSIVSCELSFDPEVATLFGKEIGQSNGDILLTIYWLIARIKVGL
jgi:hypothetical protein